MAVLSKVLVPLDRSELSERILSLVQRVLRRRAAEVTLLTVVGQPPSTPDRAWNEHLDRARAYLAQVAERLREEGVEGVSREVVAGDAAERILASVSIAQPTLVAMASHGRSGVARWVRGSVAERVLRRCPVPLLLGTPAALDSEAAAQGFRRILVPLDGSPESAEVLPLVEELARLYDATVLLVTVGNFAAPLGTAGHLSSREEMEAVLAPHVERLRAAGLEDVRPLTALGQEAQEILAAAEREDVDLVALTTHGRSGVSRWWFGSTAESLLRHLDRPILVRRTEAPTTRT